MDSFDHSEEHIDAVFNSLQEALLEIDLLGNIIRVNVSFAKLFEIDAAEMKGKPASSLTDRLIPLSDADNALVELLKEPKEPCFGYCLLRTSGGVERQFGWVSSPLRYFGAEKGTLLTLMERTEQNELKAALLHQHEDFLSVLNHRLRTPVLAAHRIIRLILDKEFGDLTQKQEEVLLLMDDNMAEINRLMLMIMDIYKYKTNSKQLSFETHFVDTLIKDAIKERQTRVPIELQLNNPKAALNCDEVEIRILINHLLENALKYSRNRVLVTVDGDDQTVVIAVEDDGKGIAEKDVKTLFNRFYVISNEGKYAPSTGAGLCLCSEIVKAHKGSIVCKSEIGQGTRFELKFPGAASYPG